MSVPISSYPRHLQCTDKCSSLQLDPVLYFSDSTGALNTTKMPVIAKNITQDTTFTNETTTIAFSTTTMTDSVTSAIIAGNSTSAPICVYICVCWIGIMRNKNHPSSYISSRYAVITTALAFWPNVCFVSHNCTN